MVPLSASSARKEVLEYGSPIACIEVGKINENTDFLRNSLAEVILAVTNKDK